MTITVLYLQFGMLVVKTPAPLPKLKGSWPGCRNEQYLILKRGRDKFESNLLSIAKKTYPSENRIMIVRQICKGITHDSWQNI